MRRSSLLCLLVPAFLVPALSARAETGQSHPKKTCGITVPSPGIQAQKLPTLGTDGFYVADAKLRSSTPQGTAPDCLIRQALFTYPDAFANSSCPNTSGPCPEWRVEMQLYDRNGRKVQGRLNYGLQTEKQGPIVLYTVNVQSDTKPLKGDFTINIRIVAMPQPGVVPTGYYCNSTNPTGKPYPILTGAIGGDGLMHYAGRLLSNTAGGGNEAACPGRQLEVMIMPPLLDPHAVVIESLLLHHDGTTVTTPLHYTKQYSTTFPDRQLYRIDANAGGVDLIGDYDFVLDFSGKSAK